MVTLIESMHEDFSFEISHPRKHFSAEITMWES